MPICVGGPCHGEQVECTGSTFHTYDPNQCCLVVYKRQGDLYIIQGLSPSQIAELCADLGLPR